MKVQDIPLDLLRPDPRNPRQEFCKVALQALADNIMSLGQQVPLIVTPIDGGFFSVIDGHRRLMAALLAGIPTLACVVMMERFTEASLRVTQMSIQAHAVALSFMERSDLLGRIKVETKWSVTELAKAVGIDQGTTTKLLCLQRLDQELKTLVHTGGLDLERAYIISGEPNPDLQRELARAAPGLSRDQLRQRVKPSTPKPSDQVKTAKAVFVRPTGDSVAVQGKELSNHIVIELLQELVRDLKRAVADNLDIKTIQQVFKDRAKAAPAT